MRNPRAICVSLQTEINTPVVMNVDTVIQVLNATRDSNDAKRNEAEKALKEVGASTSK